MIVSLSKWSSNLNFGFERTRGPNKDGIETTWNNGWSWTKTSNVHRTDIHPFSTFLYELILYMHFTNSSGQFRFKQRLCYGMTCYDCWYLLHGFSSRLNGKWHRCRPREKTGAPPCAVLHGLFGIDSRYCWRFWTVMAEPNHEDVTQKQDLRDVFSLAAKVVIYIIYYIYSWLRLEDLGCYNFVDSIITRKALVREVACSPNSMHCEWQPLRLFIQHWHRRSFLRDVILTCWSG